MNSSLLHAAQKIHSIALPPTLSSNVRFSLVQALLHRHNISTSPLVLPYTYPDLLSSLAAGDADFALFSRAELYAFFPAASATARFSLEDSLVSRKLSLVALPIAVPFSLLAKKLSADTVAYSLPAYLRHYELMSKEFPQADFFSADSLHFADALHYRRLVLSDFLLFRPDSTIDSKTTALRDTLFLLGNTGVISQAGLKEKLSSRPTIVLEKYRETLLAVLDFEVSEREATSILMTAMGIERTVSSPRAEYETDDDKSDAPILVAGGIALALGIAVVVLWLIFRRRHKSKNLPM